MPMTALSLIRWSTGLLYVSSRVSEDENTDDLFSEFFIEEGHFTGQLEYSHLFGMASRTFTHKSLDPGQ